MAENVLAPTVGLQLPVRRCGLLPVLRKHRFPIYAHAPNPEASGALRPLTCTSTNQSLLLKNLGGLIRVVTYVSSASSASTIVNDNIDFATEGIETGIEPDLGSGSGGDELNGIGGGGGGGGGDGDKGDGERPNKRSSDDKDQFESKKMGLSMSQKLTLGYAALVGIGGLMGYLKSGSQKSLMSGLLSACCLFYVNTQLPSNPVFASSVGLGISAALLGVMGSRFLKSGKIFPAGVVSLVSIIMTGGYIHGILRTKH